MSACRGSVVVQPVYKVTRKTLYSKALRTRKRCSNSRNPPSWVGNPDKQLDLLSQRLLSNVFRIMCSVATSHVSGSYRSRSRLHSTLQTPALPPHHRTSRALCNISIIPKHLMGRRYYLLRRRSFPSCRLVNKSATQLIR